MERYALISTKMPREFVLLQGTGCRWKKCTFCDYHEDVSEHPFQVNAPILRQVTGQYGVLDVINSGSALELDEDTLYVVDAWGNPLYYRCPGVRNPGSFDLISAGPDNRIGDDETGTYWNKDERKFGYSDSEMKAVSTKADKNNYDDLGNF